MGKLTRSNDRLLGGVCAGLAEFFGLRVRHVRLLTFFLIFFSFGSFAIAYVILWLLLPAKGIAAGYAERMNEKLGKK